MLAEMTVADGLSAATPTQENLVHANMRMAMAVLAAGSLFASASAQDHHHDDHGVSVHRKGFRLLDPHGHAVSGQHEHYRFVVPSVQRHGTYYTHEDKHYFTPPVRVASNGGRPVNVSPPVVMEFGASKHHEQLSERIETLANELCLDLHYNYRHNDHYRETYTEAYELLQAAKFVHAKEHQGDHEAIRRSATSIDNLFHHVQGHLGEWTSAERRPIGRLPLPAKLEELEALIHHMMYDLGVKPDHDTEGEAAPPPDREEAPPPPRNPAPRP